MNEKQTIKTTIRDLPNDEVEIIIQGTDFQQIWEEAIKFITIKKEED